MAVIGKKLLIRDLRIGTPKHLKAMEARMHKKYDLFRYTDVEEVKINGKWLSEGEIATRLQECTRLRAEVERLNDQNAFYSDLIEEMNEELESKE